MPEYDTILLLSTTKWIHLNFGDEGIKRVFKRIHAQLRPGKKGRTNDTFIYLFLGGKFILEAQHFSTYKKKKKLTETIFNHFKNIKLKPENFSDYLLHEVSGWKTRRQFIHIFIRISGWLQSVRGCCSAQPSS